MEGWHRFNIHSGASKYTPAMARSRYPILLRKGILRRENGHIRVEQFHRKSYEWPRKSLKQIMKIRDTHPFIDYVDP